MFGQAGGQNLSAKSNGAGSRAHFKAYSQNAGEAAVSLRVDVLQIVRNCAETVEHLPALTNGEIGLKTEAVASTRGKLVVPSRE